MSRRLTAIVEREGDGYVALCPEVDVASQGATVTEAHKNLEEALTLLQFMPQQAARVVAKTLKSAIANGVENFGLEADELYISRIYADQAPNRRWRRFGARGRFKPWIRRSSHITVVLEERFGDE